MPDKHFDPSQNLTGKRYLQICFDRTYGRIRRAFLQLKTYKKTYARPYFWLEVTGLGQSRYRDTSACARRASRAYNGRTVSRHLKVPQCPTDYRLWQQTMYTQFGQKWAKLHHGPSVGRRIIFALRGAGSVRSSCHNVPVSLPPLPGQSNSIFRAQVRVYIFHRSVLLYELV